MTGIVGADRTKQNRNKTKQKKKHRKMQSNMVEKNLRVTWAGKKYTPSSLAAGGRYNPRIPLISAGSDSTQDEMVWADVPVKLGQRLKDGMEKIAMDCLAENAEAVLTFYEQDILEHVVGLQANSKQLRKLLARDAAVETGDPEKYRAQAGSRLAKSSYLGKDPFGDKPLPEELCQAGGEEGSSTEGSASDGEAGTKPAKLLTSEGDLLKTIQDKAYRYARVHLRRIVDEEILTRVAAKEKEVSLYPERFTFHNHRLPWADYRQAVLQDLRKATGLHELMLILSLVRETGDTAHKWMCRLEMGRSILQSRMQTNLSDAVYVKLAVRQFTQTEVTDMARAIMARSAAHREQVTHAVAVARIEALSWADLQVLVESAVTPQRKYRQGDVQVPASERVYTHEQFLARVEPLKKRAKIDKKGRSGSKADKKGKEWIECAKCKAAGITKLSHLRHRTKDCDPKKQAERLKALGKSPKQSRKGQDRGQDREANKGKGCDRCKEAGKPYKSHDSATCYYRPGGKFDQSDIAKKPL